MLAAMGAHRSALKRLMARRGHPVALSTNKWESIFAPLRIGFLGKRKSSCISTAAGRQNNRSTVKPYSWQFSFEATRIGENASANWTSGRFFVASGQRGVFPLSFSMLSLVLFSLTVLLFSPKLSPSCLRPLFAFLALIRKGFPMAHASLSQNTVSSLRRHLRSARRPLSRQLSPLLSQMRFARRFRALALGALVAFGCPFLAHAQSGPDAPLGPDARAALQYLDSQNFTALDAELMAIQASFEKGAITEYQLRNAYRAFYNLSEPEQRAMLAWEQHSPNSYAMHLARGVELKQMGSQARGKRFISETSEASIQGMEYYFNLSSKELMSSLKLTPKPYLSVFHLMSIAGFTGDSQATLVLLNAANHMFPANQLARERYMMFLQPKWGGSHEAMEAFLARSRQDGADAAGLAILQQAVNGPCDCMASQQ